MPATFGPLGLRCRLQRGRFRSPAARNDGSRQAATRVVQRFTDQSSDDWSPRRIASPPSTRTRTFAKFVEATCYTQVVYCRDGARADESNILASPYEPSSPERCYSSNRQHWSTMSGECHPRYWRYAKRWPPVVTPSGRRSWHRDGQRPVESPCLSSLYETATELLKAYATMARDFVAVTAAAKGVRRTRRARRVSTEHLVDDSTIRLRQDRKHVLAKGRSSAPEMRRRPAGKPKASAWVLAARP